ncbi:MAG: acetyl-CoA carboxylase carboxyltransferase subunit alpha [Fimbriimonadaceae bacterium]
MIARDFNEWEKPLRELEEGLVKLRQGIEKERDPAHKKEAERALKELTKRRDNIVAATFSNLSPWEKVLVSRAPSRPYTLDYVSTIFGVYVDLQGDRRFGADHAIIGGPTSLDGLPVVVVGHQNGRNIQERQLRNFGYARPEGYRKAIRLFDIAERFRMPVITFVDTPGADAGIEAESRGISEAIAASIAKMFELTVPVVSVIIGQGGSGGAIGIAAANRVLMLEHSIYSVIAPEGCAAILWRKAEMGPQAAQALRLTAESAKELGLIEEIIQEPWGGAHRDPPAAAAAVKLALLRHLDELSGVKPDAIRDDRYERFRRIGVYGS